MDLFKHFDIDLENDTLQSVFAKVHDKGLGNCFVTISREEKKFGMLLFVTESEFMPFLEKAISEFDQFKEEGVEDESGLLQGE